MYLKNFYKKFVFPRRGGHWPPAESNIAGLQKITRNAQGKPGAQWAPLRRFRKRSAQIGPSRRGGHRPPAGSNIAGLRKAARNAQGKTGAQWAPLRRFRKRSAQMAPLRCAGKPSAQIRPSRRGGQWPPAGSNIAGLRKTVRSAEDKTGAQ